MLNQLGKSHSLTLIILFKYQLYPEIDIEGEDFNRPDHFELLHNLGCHYDSIISEINTRPVIEEAHIDCSLAGPTLTVGKGSGPRDYIDCTHCTVLTANYPRERFIPREGYDTLRSRERACIQPWIIYGCTRNTSTFRMQTIMRIRVHTGSLSVPYAD